MKRERELVQLDRDHPGFRDTAYRARRDQIARLALEWRQGAPLPRADYTEEEHRVWRTVLQALAPLHGRYASRLYRKAWPELALSPEHIPELTQLNPRLQAYAGFSLVPVAGLIDARAFMSELSESTFLATQYVRHHATPLYTPEPDVIHEVVGHAPILSSPEHARVNRLFGEAARVVGPKALQALIRVYWYAIEFGVVRGEKGLEVVGAGLLSSFGELGRLETHARLRSFSIEEMARTDYDPTRFQATLFVAQSEQVFLEDLTRWLEGLLEDATQGLDR